MKKINVPKAKRLPSGSWMCRVTAQGESRCFTGPVRSEVEAQALEYKLTHQARALSARTVGDAVAAYIRAREKVLSPATIRGYEQIKRNYFPRLMPLPLKTLTADDCQAAIADETEAHSAKSIKNAWGLVSSALAAAGCEPLRVQLPQVPVPDTPWLDPDQIPVFLEAIKGSKVELAALLGLHGLRRSEILDLTWADVEFVQADGVLRARVWVRGAAVVDKHQQLVHKRTNKNASSARVVDIWLPRLCALLLEQRKADGYLVECDPNTIYYWVNQICRQAGLPEIGVHGLRRSFASLAYSEGLSERVAARIGGWNDLATMHKHYVKVAQRDEAQAVDALRSYAAGL